MMQSFVHCVVGQSLRWREPTFLHDLRRQGQPAARRDLSTADALVHISGPRLRGRPLLDRIDIHMEIPRVAYDELAHATRGEPSAVIRPPRLAAASAIAFLHW
jgi:predicted ATPase with chaperone activity